MKHLKREDIIDNKIDDLKNIDNISFKTESNSFSNIDFDKIIV